jgi:arylsulfatase A-like enzyme
MAADLCPTLLDLARLAVPEGLDGRSLLPLARGETERLHDQVVAQHTDLAQVMMVRDGWKYLRSRRDIEYSESFSIRAGEEHLFHLRRDPAEVHNLAHESPQALAEMRRRMDQVESGLAAEGGASEIETDALMLERLQSLGYL